MGKQGKNAKESFTVEWLLFHTVNLITENQAHLPLLTRWDFLVAFSTVILKKNYEKHEELEGALAYISLRSHVLGKNQVKACANCKKNFKKQRSKIPEIDLFRHMP